MSERQQVNRKDGAAWLPVAGLLALLLLAAFNVPRVASPAAAIS